LLSIVIYFSGCLDGSSVLEQQLDHLDPVLLAGDVQRGEPVEGPRVRVGLAVQQQLGHAHVPAVGGHVQGGQVVDGHFIHGGLVVK
jgi:hypothetical protein